MNELELLKYPIGRYKTPEKVSDEEVAEVIRIFSELPNELVAMMKNFDDEKLDTPYREGGWSIRQIIHHLVTPQSRGYAFFRKGLAENQLTTKTNSENHWQDLQNRPINSTQEALQFLCDLHNSWVSDLQSFTMNELHFSFFFPDANKNISVREFIAMFAWHLNHHFSQIKALKNRKGW